MTIDQINKERARLSAELEADLRKEAECSAFVEMSCKKLGIDPTEDAIKAAYDEHAAKRKALEEELEGLLKKLNEVAV